MSVKCSLVNGIALALGSKTAVLGRAQDIGEFIRIGCHEAHLEIELKNTRRPSKNLSKITYLIRRLDGLDIEIRSCFKAN